MKPPKLLRPQFFLGVLVIVVAFLLWWSNPAWQSSTIGTLLLLAVLAIGIIAIVRDLYAFVREVSEMEEQSRKKQK